MVPALRSDSDILIVTHEWSQPCYERSMVEALVGSDGRVEVVVPERGDLVSDIQRFTAVVYFIRFSEIATWQSINWSGYCGLRVFLDTDAFMDYSWWFGDSPEKGRWEPTVRRLGFNLLMCTGRSAADHFRSRGLPATYLNKGYDPAYFSDVDLGSRNGVMHYGMPYRSRQSMLRRVRSAGIDVEDVSVGYTELNNTLNRHRAVLICNMTSQVQLGPLGKAIERLRPGTLLTLERAPEPMVKNFESLASGACVFMDRFLEFDELGLVDGANCVAYETFDELIDKLRYFLERPGLMAEIGKAGARLAVERHTWGHRAAQFRTLVDQSARSQLDH